MLSEQKPDIKVYLINVRPKEVRKYQKAHKLCIALKDTDLKSADQIITPKSIVIIEDIIDFRGGDERLMRSWLNYRAHHNRLRIFCVGHTVFKTTLQTMLPLFNYVIFTCSPSSIPLISQTVTYFRLAKEVNEDWLSKFRPLGSNIYIRVFIDCSDHKFYLLNEDRECQLLSKIGREDTTTTTTTTTTPSLLPTSSSSSLQTNSAVPATVVKNYTSNGTRSNSKCPLTTVVMPNTLRNNEMPSSSSSALTSTPIMSFEALEKRFAVFFQTHPDKSTAIAIFSIIVRVIPESIFRQFDFTVTFKKSDEREAIKRISIVDYIDTLLERVPVTSTLEEFKVLHNFLSKLCSIPKLFIKNPEFRLLNLSRLRGSDSPRGRVLPPGSTYNGHSPRQSDGLQDSEQSSESDSETSELDSATE